MEVTRRQALAAGAVAVVGGASAGTTARETGRESFLAVLDGFEGRRAVMSVKEGFDADEVVIPATALPEHIELGGLYRVEFDRSV